MAMHEDDPLVTIVTPTFNQAAYIRETIESVIEQRYSNLEYIVIDDGSTDDTPEILRSYGGRFQWMSQSNSGQTSAINRGWRIARGEILAWLNSDDTLLPGAIQAAVTYLKQNPDIGIVFGDTQYTDGAGKPLWRSSVSRSIDYKRIVIECENPIPQPSSFIRREVITNVGFLDERYYYFMDWEFWLRSGLHHSIGYLPELLSTYRLHDSSKTVSQAGRFASELAVVYSRYFERSDIPIYLLKKRRRSMANAHFRCAGYFAESGYALQAARMGMKALITYPGLIYQPSMLHKWLFCILGATGFYGQLRRMRSRRTNRACVG